MLNSALCLYYSYVMFDVFKRNLGPLFESDA